MKDEVVSVIQNGFFYKIYFFIFGNDVCDFFFVCNVYNGMFGFIVGFFNMDFSINLVNKKY